MGFTHSADPALTDACFKYFIATGHVKVQALNVRTIGFAVFYIQLAVCT